MTAGSYMYIGPQGIVHGTTITVLNAARKLGGGTAGKLFITAGLVMAKVRGGILWGILITSAIGLLIKDPATGARIRVNRRTAQRLSREAICFYQPLPMKKLGIPDLLLYLRKCLTAGTRCWSCWRRWPWRRWA